jgi:tetratricopeptide (TPR) repeat protein
MADRDYLAEIESLIEKLEDRHTPPSVQYALLAEMAGLADAADSMAALEFYLYIGGSYHALGHYVFALTAYDKAMAALRECGDSVFDDEDLAEELKDGFANMLDMVRKMEKPQAETELMALVQEIMPDSFDAIKNSKGSSLKHDPVEYTERYMAILPELEAKIEAGLKGVRRTHGFCFRRWDVQEKILRQDYGIEWKSPSVLNPRVRFD